MSVIEYIQGGGDSNRWSGPFSVPSDCVLISVRWIRTLECSPCSVASHVQLQPYITDSISYIFIYIYVVWATYFYMIITFSFRSFLMIFAVEFQPRPRQVYSHVS